MTTASPPSPVSSPALPGRVWFAGFVALLVLMPLPFGTNRPWSSDLFALVTALLLAGLGASLLRHPALWPAGGPVRRLFAAAGLVALVALWAFAQTLSVLPESWHHPLWHEIRDLPGAFAGSVSIEPDQFPEALARMLGYAGCFLLAFVAGRDPGRARTLLMALALAGAGYAVYGLAVQSSGLNMILWYDKWAYRDMLTSTFVNKNSYATYAGIGAQICLLLFWSDLKHGPDRTPAETGKAAAWVEKFTSRDVFYLLMAGLILGALVLTGSRAGLAATLAGCFALLVGLAVNRRWSWRRWLPLTVVAIVAVLGLAAFGSSVLLDRLGQGQLETDTPLRLAAYETTLRAIESNPWLGFGLGSFENAFRLYRDETVQSWFQHAHNDYLEMALELGIPAAALLVLAVLLLLTACLGGVWSRRRQEIFPILAVSSSVTVGLHSLVDFSLHIPAVAATWAALLGLGVAQSWSSRDLRREG